MLIPSQRPEVLLPANVPLASGHGATSFTIVALFEAQVAARPQAVAVTQGEQQLTYAQLNTQANQLAHYLLSLGVAAETLVPVCLPRTPPLLVALLGILKAGAAYVPLAASYPPARLRYLLLDTQARVAVGNSHTAAALAAAEVAELHVLELDGLAAAAISQQPTHNPAGSLTARHLAYVLYTSGSTGQPKGVLVEHGNVASLVHQVTYVALSPATVVLATGSPAFDATTFEYWGPLLNGGQLVLADEHQLLDSQWLAQEIKRRRVTTMWFTASWCNQLIDTALTVFEGLSTVLVGGEALSPPHMRRLQQAHPALAILNGYGPTENTTFSLTHRLTAADLAGGPLPLGQPLPGRTAHVLDDARQPVAAGAEGEIYVGGAGVARGYLGQAALTRASFGPDPFAADPAARLYRTGDRGRWRADGLLEYLGRRDEQVKLRGFRIELAEVEAALQSLAPVRSCCVVARQVGGTTTRLVGYYVPAPAAVQAHEQALAHRQVASWKELYETEYAKTEDAPAPDPEFNIIGWNDSFTGQPIPAAHMRAWLHDIVAVILAERPARVLEIGCGTGLIYYQLAGKVAHYTGTDFSRSCLHQIAQTIAQGRRDYGPTELLAGAAHELALPAGERVDTVILNSIIQYFPTEEYLTGVIEQSLELLAGPGRLLIGDVRDLRLLPLFKGLLQVPRLASSLTAKEFAWAVEQEVLKEEELCFAPEYFYRLPARYPQITHVEIRWKQGDYLNELTRYRYTVLLHVGAPAAPVALAWQNWNDEPDKQVFIAQLLQNQPTVALRDVPNPRLREERRLALALQDASDQPLAVVLSAATDHADGAAAAQLLQVAAAQGYHCRLLLDEDPLLLNVLLERQPTTGFVAQVYSAHALSARPATNSSLFADVSALLQKELRTLLTQRLPAYMVPAEFVALSHLPLTPNGKADRRFLSQRDDREAAHQRHYAPPRTAAERGLATIWQELLGVAQVGVHDNFFELGGHSLLATRVVSAVRKALAVEVGIKDLFVHPTIAELAAHLRPAAAGEAPLALGPQPRPARIPLSFGQERLWFIDQLAGSVQYHVPVVLRLRGPLSRPALAAALGALVQRHEVLRTVLRAQAGQAYQQVLPHADWQLALLDGCVYSADAEAVQLRVQQLLAQPFDLAHDAMLRASLLQLAAHEHLLVLTVHHVAADGWSLSILFRELAALYEAHAAGRPAQLAPLPVQYADFAVWQREYLSAPRLAPALAYWKEKLRGVAPLQLPTDFRRPAVQSTQGASASFRLAKELVDSLQRLSQQQGATLFMTLLAAFKTLLYRHSGQPDICVGSAIAGRQQHELEGLIGFFVNTLALRSQVRGEASFTELLQQVRATTLEAYEHQQAPFEKVVDAVGQARDLSRSPLFQVMFVLQNTPDIPSLRLGAVQASREEVPHTTAQLDFTFTLTADELGLQGLVEYSTDLYQAPTIARLLGHFQVLLQAIAQQPHQRLDALPLLPPAEPQLAPSGAGPRLAPSQTLVNLANEQAAARPHAQGTGASPPRRAAPVAPRTALEQALASIWQAVLGRASVGLDGNFFELGGDSLSTIQVVSRARQAGYPLQPKDLFTHQTIAQLAPVVAARLAAASEVSPPAASQPTRLASHESAMVALQKEGTNPPFFAIPGFLLYRHLAAHLGPNQPFYGFELPTHAPPAEVATAFMREMKQVQPHGPYFLGAFCGDYSVIFEVAHRLLAQGEAVPVVALFEAYPPVALLSKKSSQYLKQKIRIYYDQLQKKTVAETVKFIGEEVRLKFRFIARRITGNKPAPPTIENYPGKVVLFKASILTPGLVDDPLGGWAEHVTGDIEVFTVSGDHITIFKEPGVQELAEKLSLVLAKARS